MMAIVVLIKASFYGHIDSDYSSSVHCNNCSIMGVKPMSLLLMAFYAVWWKAVLEHTAGSGRDSGNKKVISVVQPVLVATLIYLVRVVLTCRRTLNESVLNYLHTFFAMEIFKARVVVKLLDMNMSIVIFKKNR